jgi:hypothetical protein
VIAIGLYPTCQSYFFTRIIQPKLPTIVCSLEHSKDPKIEDSETDKQT